MSEMSCPEAGNRSHQPVLIINPINLSVNSTIYLPKSLYFDRINHMPEKFLKPYDAQAVEAAIYKKWEESGYFNPDKLPPVEDAEGAKHERTEPFSIVLPPPNVTGTLHLGHAAMLAVEDIVVRFE